MMLATWKGKKKGEVAQGGEGRRGKRKPESEGEGGPGGGPRSGVVVVKASGGVAYPFGSVRAVGKSDERELYPRGRLRVARSARVVCALKWIRGWEEWLCLANFLSLSYTSANEFVFMTTTERQRG